MANTLGIRGYDYLELYVGSARMAAFWWAKAMGLDIVGYKGPETGSPDRMSFYLSKNDLKFVVTSTIKAEHCEVSSFVSEHGDGVKRWSMEVDDVQRIFDHATKNGAVPVTPPREYKDDNGVFLEAAIKLYDDTQLMFVNRDDYKGIHRPGFDEPRQKITLDRHDTGIRNIDHIVGNVRVNEMNLWASYFEKALAFETFVDFGPGDISTRYSALLSKVVRSSDSAIRNPINEPHEGLKRSQIEEYIDEYNGSGVQHIAIATDDIISSISALRANGVEFLSVPDTYYEDQKAKGFEINENWDDLQERGILVDNEGDGYLLQLFTKPIGDRPTLFLEIIQRQGGSEGFGHGNFQALFEAIERDQMARGSL